MECNNRVNPILQTDQPEQQAEEDGGHFLASSEALILEETYLLLRI